MVDPGYNGLSDAETAATAFWGQDKWRKLRDNQTSHEARIQQLLAQSNQAIVDDFLSDTEGGGDDAHGVDASGLYTVSGSATGFKTMIGSSGDHALQINTVAVATTKAIQSRANRFAVRLNQDMAFFVEARTKDVGGTAPDNMIVGYSANAAPSNEGDVIAFLKASSAGKWRFRVAKGGVQSETDNIAGSNRATWQKLRIEVTRSGGGSTFQVRAYIDGAEISGSPFTTNIPDTTVLRLIWGAITPGAGTTDFRLDRWEHRLTAVPVNS